MPRVPVRGTPIDPLIPDAGIHVRAVFDDNVVEDYTARLATGVEFPPVVVFRDGSGCNLTDGVHRVSAFRRDRRPELEADVGRVRAQGDTTLALPNGSDLVRGVDGELHRPYARGASSGPSDASADPDVSVAARQAQSDPVPARGDDDSPSLRKPSAADPRDSSLPSSIDATALGPAAPASTSERDTDQGVSWEPRPSRRSQNRSNRVCHLEQAGAISAVSVSSYTVHKGGGW